MSSLDARASHLRSLHTPGRPLVLANVYDAASAEVVALHSSSTALATSSAAIAAVNGLKDDDLDLKTHISSLQKIIPVALKQNKPITIDMQDGYGDRIEEAITEIIKLGASGANIEDKDKHTGKLYPIEEATSRLKRVLAAAAKTGVPNFVLNARTDVLLTGGSFADALERGKAYLAVGATTVFIVGGMSRDEIITAAKE